MSVIIHALLDLLQLTHRIRLFVALAAADCIDKCCVWMDLGLFPGDIQPLQELLATTISLIML